MAYLRNLRQIVEERGSGNLVYVDESGFESSSYRPYGWAAAGQKVYGERSGNSRPRTNLIAAHKGKAFLAPLLFKGEANAAFVNEWIESHLLPELQPASTIIMDNARFHHKGNITKIVQKHGHFVLFLPPYSPDFNPIEQDFAIIKKHRQNTPDKNLSEIVAMYNCYS